MNVDHATSRTTEGYFHSNADLGGVMSVRNAIQVICKKDKKRFTTTGL